MTPQGRPEAAVSRRYRSESQARCKVDGNEETNPELISTSSIVAVFEQSICQCAWRKTASYFRLDVMDINRWEFRVQLGVPVRVQAIVGSIVWAFRRLKKPRCREMSARGFTLHSVCPQLSCSNKKVSPAHPEYSPAHQPGVLPRGSGRVLTRGLSRCGQVRIAFWREPTDGRGPIFRTTATRAKAQHSTEKSILLREKY